MFYLKIIKKIFLVLSLLLIIGCQTISNHGKYIDDSKIRELNNSKLHAEEVIDLLGTPTFVPSECSNNWYYIHSTTSKRAFFSPHVYKQRVVKLVFDNDNLVIVKVDDSVPNYNIKLAPEHVNPNIIKMSPIQKFYSNIGRFNKSKKKKYR